MEKRIIGYFKESNILIIYNHKQKTDEIVTDFKKQNTKIEFTIWKKQDNAIEFVLLRIHRRNTKIEVEISRKPTQTDIILPKDTCRPYEHKICAINYRINRANNYPITKETKKK
jgi:hypothetical protein